jgi:hypothetical protein
MHCAGSVSECRVCKLVLHSTWGRSIGKMSTFVPLGAHQVIKNAQL